MLKNEKFRIKRQNTKKKKLKWSIFCSHGSMYTLLIISSTPYLNYCLRVSRGQPTGWEPLN